jgi:hypothetical protein
MVSNQAFIGPPAIGISEVGEPFAGVLGAAADQPVGHHHGVDRTGRGARHAFDLDSAVGQQLVEHAPGERAVRAAALKREIDALLAARRRIFRAAQGAGDNVHHSAVQPPSMERLAPVIEAARSEVR